MGSWNSGNGYARNQEEDVLHGQQWANRDKYAAPGVGKSRAKRNICIALLCLVVVLVVVLAIAIPVAVKNHKKKNKDDSDGGSNPSNSLKLACTSATLYPDVCYSSLSSVMNSSDSLTPQTLVKYAITVARDGVSEDLSEIEALLANTTGPLSDNASKAAGNDCLSFLQDASDSLNDTMDEYQDFSLANAKQDLADMQTWVSAALTNQETCLDGFKDLNLGSTNDGLDEFLKQGEYSSKLLSNVLAFLVKLKDATNTLPNIPGTRRLLSDDGPSTLHVEFLKRRLLQTSNPTANVTVALDGTGTYKKIQDAVNQAIKADLDSDSQERFVIHVKAGNYKEQVLIPKSANNVMLIGDGIGKTIISGSLSVIGNNITTSLTATLTVQAKNFVGRGFTVENTAGAVNHQAVAVRATGDYGAFQNCEFLGFQDTLYAHTNRQFYTGCSVTGTVDFVFGNAAAVFQNCTIIASKGMLGQQNTYTASGRTDPNQNTGLIFQQCTFAVTSDLASAPSGTYLTYLGRPWKDYARTVVMRSHETGRLDPTGWLLWNGNSSNTKTVYYGEYQNNGPGYVPSKRVTWSKQISLSQAQGFSANTFVQASGWLPQNNLSYSTSV